MDRVIEQAADAAEAPAATAAGPLAWAFTGGRACVRLVRVLALCGLWGAGALLRPWRTLDERLADLQRTTRRALAALAVRVDVEGALPDGPYVVVANHRTFVDVGLLLSLAPLVFVSKAALRWWPFMGWVVSLAGTLYVKRNLPGSVVATIRRIAARAREGRHVVVFPEGTTNPQAGRVLPLKHGAFRAALLAGVPVVPVALEYGAPDAGWGEETLFGHFFRVFGRPSLRAVLVVGPRIDSDDVEVLKDEAEAWFTRTLPGLYERACRDEAAHP